MTDPPVTRGSPSKQLTAFTPPGLDYSSRRGNAASSSGTGSIRQTRDPFSGWPTSIEGHHAPVFNSSFAPQGSSSIVSGRGQASIVAGSNQYPAQLPGHQRQRSIDQFGYPVISPQLTPSHNTGPSGASQYRVSGSGLGQYQCSPTRAQAVLSQSQYPVSPNQRDPRGVSYQNEHGSRYSPFRDVSTANVPYNPADRFINEVIAEVEGHGSYVPAHGYNNMSSVQLSSTRDVSSELGQALVPSQLPLLGTPRRASFGIEPRRNLIVENIPHETDHGSILRLTLLAQYPSLEGVCIRKVHTAGRFSLMFADVREAMAVKRKLELIYPTWNVKYASLHQLVTAGLIAPFPHISSQEDGSLMISVLFDPGKTGPQVNENNDQNVEAILSSFGHLRQFRSISERGANLREYAAEYYNIHHASNAFCSLDNLVLGSMRFDATVLSQSQALERYQVPGMGSPTSPLTPYQNSPGSGEETEEPTSPALEGSPTAEHAIDLGRIRRGEDVRTTIMIRNIPNKITSEQLKSILDESNLGQFDFLYLRMDFVHRCNVGYAFVNFPDPIHIIELVMARQGRTWPDCISEKRAEISYATQQGRDALISKFRNSNVMTRPHDERPHLFYTDGPRAGLEAPFPAPNDATKLRRSVASTHQQGLFAPRTRSGSSPRALRNRTRSISTLPSAAAQSPPQPSTQMSRHVSARSLNSPPGEFSSPMQLDDQSQDLSRHISQNDRARKDHN